MRDICIINNDYKYQGIVRDIDVFIELAKETKLGELYSDFEVIKKSKLVIAIISEEDVKTYLELGFALGQGKRVFIFVQYNINLPQELENIAICRFDTRRELIYEVNKILQEEQISKEYTDNKLADEDLDKFMKNSDILMLQEYIESLNAFEFEEIIYRLFKRKGYIVENNSSRYDSGYDLVIDAFVEKKRALIEVKKYSKNNKVSIASIQQLGGAMYEYKADKGILITTSDFSSSARRYADTCSLDIELWTLEKMLSFFLEDK